MYEIIFSDTASKQFKKLEQKIQQRIFNALDRIKIRPEAYLIKLVGQDLYKFRVGEYRLLMDLFQDKLVILVVKVGHRRNVYK